MMQSGFFDLENSHRKLDEKDPLIQLNQLIDWEQFSDTLKPIRSGKMKNNAGRKLYDLVLMFKVLVLQHLYNISDDETEYMIRDSYSFCRLLELAPEDNIPDAKTIWLFREQLIQHQLTEALFDRFNRQLDQQAYQAKKGQIVDSSFVDIPRQRNTREENAQIKAGEVPERFQENTHVKAQKDTDARWTKKNQETHFGYKNHVTVDNQHKLIRNYQMTSAEVHDSKVFVDLLVDNSSKSVWADSAYRSEAIEDSLEEGGYRSHVHKKEKKISH
jgi:IS5 family transposase